MSKSKVSSTDPVRHAVIGLGRVGRRHAQAIATSRFGELVAVVDPDSEARAWAVDRYGVRAFPTYIDLLGAGLVESVTLAIPHRLKDRAALECVEAGLHVYVEKPLAILVGTARRLVAAAEESNVSLTVGHQYRTFRTPQTIKRLIDSETLGQLDEVLWTWHQFRTDLYFEGKPWQQSWAEAGGGLLALQLAHDLDLLAWLMGPPSRVTALLRDHLHGRGIEDSASAILEFESGAVATVQASVNRPTAHILRHIVGDRAMLVIPDARSIVSDEPEELLLGRFDLPLRNALGELRESHAQPGIHWEQLSQLPQLGAEPKWKRPRKVWRKLGMYSNRRGKAAVVDSFFQEIRGRGKSLVPASSALASVELRNAMVLSSLESRSIELPLDGEEVKRVYDRIEQEGFSAVAEQRRY